MVVAIVVATSVMEWLIHVSWNKTQITGRQNVQKLVP